MLKKRFFAVAVIVILNVVISALVGTYLNHPRVSLAAGPVAQSPGAVVSAKDRQQVTSREFTDIPGMVLTTSSSAVGNLLVIFSLDGSTGGPATVRVRCLIDGNEAQPGQRLALPAHQVVGTTLTFHLPGVAPGSHQVRIQWRMEGLGLAVAQQRMLAAVTVP